MKIKVAIYEDNASLRNSLVELINLHSELSVVYANIDCTQIIEDVQEYDPTIILMDLDLPKMSGIEGIKLLRTAFEKTIVLVLTVFDDNDKIINALKAGANGYLIKKNCAETLIPSIFQAIDKGVAMSPEITKSLVESFHLNPKNSYALNQRENDILNCLAKGMSYKMISSELELSFETVRSYVKNLYLKLNVHSATEAVAKAQKENLI